MMMIDRNELIYKLKTSNPELTWRDLVNVLGKEYGIVTTVDAVRKGYYRQEKKYSKLDKQVIKPVEKVSVERKQDGTMISDRKILMSETDMKDDAFVLRAHGFDPDKYEIINIVNNLWTSQSAEDGELLNYQSKITVKPKKNDELTKQDLLDLFNDFSYKHKPLKVPQEIIGGRACFVEVGDLHIGLFSWEEETGENADYAIIEGKLKEVTAKIKKFIMNDKRIDRVYLIFGGDILHADNDNNETTGGTQMHFDGRIKKMIRVAYKILSYIILELSVVKKIYIKVLEGNHSRVLEFAVFEGLKNMFSEFDNIEFDNSPMARKAILYGVNLIGLAHGDLPNSKNKTWLQNDFAELWGKSKKREIHLFHLHKEEKEETEGGITIRRNPTIKPTDHYEYFNAFVGADKKIACYVYDEKEGLESIHYFRSMFTK